MRIRISAITPMTTICTPTIINKAEKIGNGVSTKSRKLNILRIIEPEPAKNPKSKLTKPIPPKKSLR